MSSGELAVKFARAVTAVGGVCTYASTVRDGLDATRRLLGAAAPSGPGRLRIGVSHAPLARVVSSEIQAYHDAEWELLLEESLPKADIFSLDVGITGAQWGIAETGTLVLSTTDERNRLLSLVPPVHLALLRERDIVATAAEVLAEVGRQILGGNDGEGSAVTFITGPSRTSDIELTPVLGAHGPGQLHVIIIGDDTNLDSP